MKLARRIILWALLSGTAFAADDVPSWLREFSSAKTPAYPPKVPAVVLLDEETVTVEETGRVTTSNRKAVKILTRDGRKAAIASRVYVTSSGKVRDLRAWMIRPSGDVKKYGKDRIMDVALAQNDVYNEARAKAVDASDDADAGAVFGYESVSEDRSVFTQFEWGFQNHLPALLSRYVLTLPARWQAEGVVFNAKVTPQVSGSTYSWECRNLPFIDDEPSSPSMAALAPRVAVSYFPAESARATMGKVFNGGWPDVSRWLAEIGDPQAAADDAITAKVRALTGDAKTELDRIRAIGHYAQTVKYVSIQTGLGRGGGYRPHLASEVFQKQCGDCKDKANLMRAMLKVAGIRSYMVTIYSGDPTYVREDWPSPQQFNHAIIAVGLTDPATAAAAVIQHPKLGRLLIFDPTDDDTPLGDLPQHEQGSLALIDAAEGGGLVRMPSIPPSANRVERDTQVVLGPDGAITSVVREQAYGQNAASFRYRFRAQAAGDFVKGIERWIASGANGANVAKVQPSDSFLEGRFDLQLEFTAARYAQLMQGRLMIFRPSILPRRTGLHFSEAKRQNPVVLHGERFQETVRVKLPAGFKIDEMPSSGKIETEFGTFSASYSAKADEMLFTRNLEIRPSTVPVERYAELKTFFERVLGAEQAPVVLVKE